MHVPAFARRSAWVAAAGIVLSLLAAHAVPQAAGLAASTATLHPTSYVTLNGSDGGQPVSNLAVQDQSGTQNDWNRYVEFDTDSANNVPYRGYRTYVLPGSIAPASITALQVQANYLGSTKSVQTWTWRIYNWSTGSWVVLGDNANAADWSWSLLTFTVTGSTASYVNSSGQIRIEVDSNNAVDNADLDYEAVIVTFGGAGAPPTPTQTRATAVAQTPTAPAPTSAPSRPQPTNTPSSAPPTATPTTPSGSSGLPAPVPCAGCWIPAPVTSWQWQLSGSVDQSVNVTLYDIDGFDNAASVVASLHQQGRKVACYIDAGTWENWRPDAGQFPASVQGNGVSGWPGEKWLDIRQLSILGPLMQNRLDMCKSKGFDSVELDNVDGYTNPTGFPLSAGDQLRYNVFLANEAHKRGLSVALKNDLDQVPQLLPYFDWALNEQCFEYSECAALQPFVKAGKAVMEVEYNVAPAQFCPQANADNFNALYKHLSLDAYRVACR